MPTYAQEDEANFDPTFQFILSEPTNLTSPMQNVLTPEFTLNLEESQINLQRIPVIQMPTGNSQQSPTTQIDPNIIGNINNINNANGQATIGIDTHNIINAGLPQLTPNINQTQNKPMMLPNSQK